MEVRGRTKCTKVQKSEKSMEMCRFHMKYGRNFGTCVEKGGQLLKGHKLPGISHISDIFRFLNWKVGDIRGARPLLFRVGDFEENS